MIPINDDFVLIESPEDFEAYKSTINGPPGSWLFADYPDQFPAIVTGQFYYNDNGADEYHFRWIYPSELQVAINEWDMEHPRRARPIESSDDKGVIEAELQDLHEMLL